MDKPGLKIDDVTTDNAYAIGFWIPNADNTELKPQSNWTAKDAQNNYKYIKSVQEIEQLTGL